MALTRFPHANSKGQDYDEFDGVRVYEGYVQGDSSYPTGGYPVDPTLFGMAQIDQVIAGGINVSGAIAFAPAAPTGLQTSNVTLKVVNPTTGAEVAAATNLSAAVWPVLVVGT